ncbi:MAG: class I SAM-dependent methyltransferase [Gemmatimonadota bacterium]
MKRYDRAYYEHWYRNPAYRIGSAAVLKRKVSLAVALAEWVIDRPIKSVLDVGCGEGRWQPVLYRLRPKASYLGIDSSEYAIERYGGRRNLRLGTFEELGQHVFDRPFDLVVCSDVLHYLTRSQLVQGLEALVPLVGGVALLEAFTSEDDIEGDHHDFQRRSAATYRRLFSDAGLVPCGMQSYVRADRAVDLTALELGL